MELIRRENAMNAANLLTLSRIALLPAVAYLYRKGNAAGTLAVYLVSMLTDVADGFVARHFHQQTQIGKLLDPLADKLSLLVMLGLLASDGQIPAWVFVLVLLKETALTLGSCMALERGVVVTALPIGKATTFCFALMIVFRLQSLYALSNVLLSVSLLLSFAALFGYGWVLLCRFRMDDTVLTK